MYLKYMGNCDGGLIGDVLNGIASIEEMIELYEEISEFCDPVENRRLIIFSSEVNAEYEIELDGKKAWFSDEHIYCSIGDEMTFWILKWTSCDVIAACFMGNNKKQIERICQELATTIDVDMD